MEYYVTEIKEINSKRRLIYINYEPAFALYPSEIRKYHIAKDKLLSEEDYAEITEVLLVKRARIRAMNLLKNKDYTVHELEQKLFDTYYPETAVQKAIEYVTSYGYLNDVRYAESYLVMKGESKSRKQIEQFLYQKGIDKEIIESACNSYYADNADMEIQQAITYLRKKLGTRNIVDLDFKEKNKLYGYLYRHGFGMDTVRKALDIVVETTEAW